MENPSFPTKMDSDMSRPKLQRSTKVKTLIEATETTRFDQLIKRISEILEKKETLEKQIDELLEKIIQTDLKTTPELIQKMELLESELEDTENDLYSKTKSLSKMKKDWRKQLISDHILAKKQEKQKLMQEMLRKQALSTESFHDSFLKISSVRSRENSFHEDSIYPRSKWDIPSNNLEFSINEPIGKGQFGTVYRGKLLGKVVAVKILSTQELDEDMLNEFVKEISIMVTLRHPNIILFIGACTETGNLAVVTEFMARGSVMDIIHPKNGEPSKISIKRKFTFAKETAQGMNWLHQIEPAFLHLDLKPANLLVDENWIVKVSDFGLSRMKNAETSVDGLVGSPMYMSPEMMLGKNPTTKSDVYSFGIILWEIYTEKIPYDNRFESFDELIEAITIDNERPPLPDSCPPTLKKLMTSCWNENPDIRPSFSDMLTSNIFEDLIIEGTIGPEHQLGRSLWKENFFDRWQVPWKDFLGGFISYLDIILDPIAQDVMECLKQTIVVNDIIEDMVTLENYAAMLYWLGPLEKGSLFIYKLLEIFKKPYFHGVLSSTAAEKLLAKKKRGTYLIRLTTNEPGSYAISWISKNEIIYHTNISHQTGLGFSLNGQEFSSLDEIVNSKSLKLMKPKIRCKIPLYPTPFSNYFTKDKMNASLRRKSIIY